LKVLYSCVTVSCAVVSVAAVFVGYFRLFPALQTMLSEFELSEEGDIKHVREYIADVINVFSESIVVVNPEGRIERGNKSTTEFFGEDFLDKCVFDFIHLDDLKLFHRFAEASSTHYDPLDASDHSMRGFDVLECRVRRDDLGSSDDYVWVESKLCMKETVGDAATKGIGTYEVNMVTRNIHQRQMTEVSKIETANNAAKLRYISCTAHDLKTPLHTFGLALNMPNACKFTDQGSISLSVSVGACAGAKRGDAALSFPQQQRPAAAPAPTTQFDCLRCG
jgi:hypothetical protein